MVSVCDAVLREQKEEQNAQEVWLLPSVGESALSFKNWYGPGAILNPDKSMLLLDKGVSFSCQDKELTSGISAFLPFPDGFH